MMIDDEHKHDEAESEEGEVSDDALDEVFEGEDDAEGLEDDHEKDDRSAFGDDGLDE